MHEDKTLIHTKKTLTMPFLLADHQLGIYSVFANNLPHPDRLLDSDTAIHLTMSNGKRNRNIGRVVDG